VQPSTVLALVPPDLQARGRLATTARPRLQLDSLAQGRILRI